MKERNDLLDQFTVYVEESRSPMGDRVTMEIIDQDGERVELTKARWGTDHGTFLLRTQNDVVEIPFWAVKDFFAAFGR